MTDTAHPLAQPAVVEIAWTDAPITLDGKLDEAVWQEARVYSLTLPTDQANKGGDTPLEAGTVRFAWDATHFYAAFDFVDRDVVQESDRDHQHHYSTGDVAELFLKPKEASHYWEFYVTPNSRRTTFFYPGRGRLGLTSTIDRHSGMQAAAHVQGTLNDWRDTDRGWTAEMAIPRHELAAAGVPLDQDHPWTLLVGRYNYGRHLSTVERSSLPKLQETNFHVYEAYVETHLHPNGNATPHS